MCYNLYECRWGCSQRRFAVSRSIHHRHRYSHPRIHALNRSFHSQIHFLSHTASIYPLTIKPYLYYFVIQNDSESQVHDEAGKSIEPG